MRLTITDDAGTLLDSIDITEEDYLQEVHHSPAGLLAQLNPGNLGAPARFLVVTSSSSMRQLAPYLYGSSSIVESFNLERNGAPLTMLVVQVTGRDERDAIARSEYQADRFSSGLHTVWTSATSRAAALAETVVVRGTLNASVAAS